MVCCGCVKINADAVKLLSLIPSILGKGVRYLAGLAESRTAFLSAEADRLKARKIDLEGKVKDQESIQLRRRRRSVDQLLTEAADLIDEVDKFKGSCIHSIPCLKDCPCWATDMLERVRNLTNQIDGLNQVLGEEPLLISNEVPNPQIVGMEETLSAVRGLVGNSDAKIVGIYGMPGIGKTTLLQKIYHDLRGARGDPSTAVVYARVSREPSIPSLQKYIAQGLGLTLAEDGPSDAPPPETQQARTLFRELSKNKSILLLDDVWEALDWKRIGITSPGGEQSPCKIVFATPLRQVCIDMEAGASIVRVGFLSESQSWELFCLKVKKSVDDPSIAPARAVINRCGGLPRAVIALSDYVLTAPNRSCQEIAKKLKHSLHEIGGMKDKVLSPLKCSFDKLEEKTKQQMEERAVEMRQCLLYCSLFPVDQNIYIDQLIDYWIGEGFLDATCHLTHRAARDKGREIVRTLMEECFLEGIATYADDHNEAKLHHVVRGMAMWLTDGNSEQSTLFLTSTRLTDFTHRRWEMAERISSMDNGLKVFPSSKINCPRLLTFLFNNYSIEQQHRRIEGRKQSDVQGEPNNLFQFARALRVLDLSGTKIGTLPTEICNIAELQYLNVSYTDIESLPKRLNRLMKLRQLRLRGTPRLSDIPNGCISPATILQIFDLFDSGYCWRPSTKYPFLGGQIDLEEISTRNYLKEIGLTIANSQSLERSCGSRELPNSTVFLKLKDIEGLLEDHLSSVFRTMENLRELSVFFDRNSPHMVKKLEIGTSQLPKLQVLDLHNLTSLSSIEVVGGTGSFLNNLHHLQIFNCHGFAHVTWVHRLPSLVEIVLRDCQGVRGVLVAEHVPGNHCSLSRKLRKIHLMGLPNLTSIADRPLSSPSLEIISVTDCPQFERFSFDIDTAASVKEIRGERGWWDGLQWDENDATSLVLQTRFVESSRR